MRTALLIARKDLRSRFRDRSALVLGFVAPLAIATVMSFAFKSSESFSMTLVVVDADASTMGAAVRGVLESDELSRIVTVTTAPTKRAATALVKDGAADAGLVVPEGFTESVGGASPVDLQVLTSVDTPLAGQVTQSIASSFAAQIDADRLSVATAISAGATPSELPELAAAAAASRLPVSVVELSAGSRPLKPISYYAPAMGMFFLFFAIGFTARSWFSEASEGTLERMAAATSLREILVGKAMSVFVYGTASLTTMAVVTTFAFGADWGGFFPAATLILAMVFSVVCLTALVIVVARTERQAEGFSSVLVFGLALLGGNFVFVSAAPPLLRKLTLFTPNGWALRAFVDLATGERTMSVVWVPLVGILTFSAVIVAVTALMSRRLVLR